ncbi:hypothetical protein MARGE09_P0687 [Marinagarivorans cellulosilyticus]|uniref:Flavin-nucleotide-binding protein n=2 Tax=Marinagarivorans cellulosilyticus TaxID=2721545 RepID=A0AAN1WF73_9GAMM|nr:hypothetical protein MARGE09_P0687 [Marinagarivorans cellulosilyticus]
MREKMAAIGKRVIRPYMPEQHRTFYGQLPFLVAGGIDELGWPWASVVSGQPGFAHSPTSTQLHLSSQAIQRLVDRKDPLTRTLTQPNSPIALLGIELNTRRRNRLNGRIATHSDGSATLEVDQAFGNCPKYIHTRELQFDNSTIASQAPNRPTEITTLDFAAQAFIQTADTFFVASSTTVDAKMPQANQGVDVSHRGGKPGFVKIEGNTLTIPDFAGNFHFNTLGNFLLNPKAGLVFPNFVTGDLLMLTGRVELLTEDDSTIRDFKGADRGWRFCLEKGLKMPRALGFSAKLVQTSPTTKTTGDWPSNIAIP